MAKKKRLGDLLIEVGLLTQEQLNQALNLQKSTKERLGDILISKGFITESQLIEVLEFQLGIPHVILSRIKIDRSVINIITESIAKRYLVLPIKKNGNKLTIAMADPLDYYAIDDLRMSTGFEIEPVIAAKDEIKQFIDRYYGLQESMDEVLESIPHEEELETQITNDDAPVVRLVNQILQQAVQLGASDIHFDPGAEWLAIRFRIDGVMRTEQKLPKYMQNVITARLKIMSNLNIAERRIPQDGRIQLEINYKQVDIRISTLPTVHGEKCVLRILDISNAIQDIDKLGMNKQNKELYRNMIHHAHGIVLITGPTGSGKTSTLYAALNELNTGNENIITIEDPVEYQIEGINQVQVNQAAGMTFAKGLRAILRQDPDIIMVGEIRDTETAEIAVRAALTGHLVLSTLHTNDAVSSLTRLIDMGIEPFLVTSCVVGIVAQRLVRRVCNECVEVYTPSDAEREFLKQHNRDQIRLTRGRGCGYCNQTGYKGRIAIHELIKMNDELRAMVVERKTDDEIRRFAIQQGMRTLLMDGLDKVAQGYTTLSEVLRVTLRD
jgi:type IV pilus assembly protein PilB